MKITQVINTDVLVIGGGGAGIMAAVAAARGGAKVLLVSKGQVGNSGNTIMIGGSFSMDGETANKTYGVKEADASLTKEVLYDSIMNDGFHLNDQNMVEQFVEESPPIIWEIVQWAEERGKPFWFRHPSSWSMSGNMLGGAMRFGLEKEKNASCMNDIMVTELLKNGDAVCGALGYNVYTGELYEFCAKAVVLGTGGFQPFSLKNTNYDMTGDGPAMALRAGAKLADMEFMLFLLTALEPQHMKGSIMPLFVATNPYFSYRALDGKGKELKMHPDLKAIEPKSEVCKLMHIVYYGKAICGVDGQTPSPHGGFYIEPTCSDEDLDKTYDRICWRFDNFYKKGYYHGEEIKEVIDLLKEKRKWEVGLVNEYTLGGVLVDEKMTSSVPGLFAGGECASGVFGANRVADALTEMVVQGYRAGQTAGEYVQGKELLDPQNVDAALDFTTKIFSQDGDLLINEAIRRFEAISDKYLNCYRTGEGLKKAVEEYEALERELDHIKLKDKGLAYNYEYIQYMQLRSRLTCSKLAAIMGEYRKESRGLHLRLDYPDIDNKNFRKRTIAQLAGDGKIELTTREPIGGRFQIDLPDSIGYEQYLLESDLGLENL